MRMHDSADAMMVRARLSRRAILGGVAGSAAVAILAACGGSSPTATPAATKPAATTGAAPTTASAQPTTASGSAPAATTGAAPTTAPATASSAGATTAAPTTAATQAASAGPVKKGGTIKAEINSDVQNLDPLYSSLLVDRQIHYNIYDSLLALDKDSKIIPSLAESWQQPDPKTYIFKLRQGVKFHDGTDFNADAVKFNLDRALTDKKSSRVAEIGFVQTVEVVDPLTVKLNLKAPFAPLLANLVDRAGMMLSPKAIQAGGEDFTRKPLGAGTGAFKFVEWVKDDHITLERNPNYWKKDAAGNQLPYLDKVTIRPIVDATVALANLKTGDVDISHYVAPKDFEGVKNGKDLILQSTPGLGYASIVLNPQAPPFNKKELRQAFAEAIDRDQILKTVFFGVGQVAYGPFPPPNFAYDPNFKPYTGSADKAKQYLAAGGQPNGFACEMKITSGDPVAAQLAQLAKDELSKVGITMNLVQLDFPTLVADTNAGKYQASLAGWSGRIDPDGNTYNQWHTGTPNNLYSNPQVDDLLDKARASSDQAERKSLYQQAQKTAVDDAPLVYYQFPLTVMLTRPNVQGMQVYADGIMRFEVGWLK